jgi:hypothetical protein
VSRPPDWPPPDLLDRLGVLAPKPRGRNPGERDCGSGVSPVERAPGLWLRQQKIVVWVLGMTFHQAKRVGDG